jgi:hypothetical protein
VYNDETNGIFLKGIQEALDGSRALIEREIQAHNIMFEHVRIDPPTPVEQRLHDQVIAQYNAVLKQIDLALADVTTLRIAHRNSQDEIASWHRGMALLLYTLGDQNVSRDAHVVIPPDPIIEMYDDMFHLRIRLVRDADGRPVSARHLERSRE